MILMSILLGGLGLISLLYRRTWIGLLVGVQLLVLGSTTFLLMTAGQAGSADRGQLFAMFVIFSGVSQLVIGFALGARLFYLRETVEMKEIRETKS